MARASPKPGPYRASTSANSRLKERTNDVSRLRRWHDWDDLGFEEFVPAQHPFLEQARVVAGHELKTAAKVSFNPASLVGESLRHRTSLVSQAAVDVRNRARFEPLDHHE